ncbi:DUF1772 domain-containing protein [Nocardia yunnanensis]|uniref:DUF1772 domain-containing protein n=1 Tax=Nocardia yunnanensis TaxID=2382165 RepID=A0A386Z758_9NOCA|nr:DUF1772 domain-containing protein [Nocardia yunnanensis]AYF73481.1 DUF1772 domain-containing protein [Nocardia yunnanensis]
MLVLTCQILAALAVLANAVVYGTDWSVALITRSVYRDHLDDATMTISAGWGHYYGDKRMPLFGAGGVITAALALILAALAGQTAATLAAAVALAALLTWLALYVKIAKPINTAQTTAAQTGVIPPNARALQSKWDSILNTRVALQLLALAALLATLALL